MHTMVADGDQAVVIVEIDSDGISCRCISKFAKFNLVCRCSLNTALALSHFT